MDARIAGMGWVTPLGADLTTVWERLAAGEIPACAYARRNARTCPVVFGAVSPFSLPSLEDPTPRMTA